MEEGSGARQEYVIEAEVEDSREGLAEGDEGAHRTDDSSSDDVVPVVELVDSERASDERGSEDGSKEEDHLPVGGVVRAHDLELGVEVERQVEQSGPCSGRVPRWHGLQGIVDLVRVSGANIAIENDVVEAIEAEPALGYIRLANGVEVRTEAANEPLDKDLEGSGGDQTWRVHSCQWHKHGREDSIYALFNNPIVLVSQSSMLRRRIWNRVMKTNGTKKAMSAAAQMGMISFLKG